MPMPGDRLVDTWEVGQYQFRQWRDKTGRDLYDFTIDGKRDGLTEVYVSLDHALVAAVGEKYTGSRGAGGNGVDTAAGWFMRMIGADDPRCPEPDCGEPLRLIAAGSVGHCGIRCGN